MTSERAQMPTANPDLDAIVAAREHSGPISRNDVVNWMRSGDIEVLGALYHLITDRRFSSRIEPPLSFDEYQSFARHYFGRCFREDPAGAWSNSRYSAGWDLVNWVASLWKDKQHRNAVDQWKQWLADMYKQGDDALRTCIVTATLEHLFEQRGIQKYFVDWTADPVLARAYGEAAEWVDHGGRTDLGSESR